MNQLGMSTFANPPPQTDICPISLQSENPYCQTSCGHVYGFCNLRLWLRYGNRCPLCQRKLYIEPASDFQAALYLRSNKLDRNQGLQLDTRMEISREHLTPYVSEVAKLVRGNARFSHDHWSRVLLGMNYILHLYNHKYLTPRQLRNRLFGGILHSLRVLIKDVPQYPVDVDPIGGLFERQVDEVLDLVRDLYASRVPYQ